MAGFIFAALAYYDMEQQDAFDKALQASQAVEMDSEDNLNDEEKLDQELDTSNFSH